MYSSFCGDFTRKRTVGDTTLKLDGFGYGQTNSGEQNTCTNVQDDGCKLVLGLGPTPTAYSGEYSPSSSRANKAKEQHDSILKLGLSGSIDAVSNVLEFSVSSQRLDDSNKFALPILDEGSTSAKKSVGGYMRRLVMAPRMENPGTLLSPSSNIPLLGGKSYSQVSSAEPSAVSNYSMSAISEPGSATISSDPKPRRCNFPGCAKGARGSTGLCIGHGGGQRCQKPGCDKGAESRMVYCKAHGGGNRCQQLGCTKSAEGKTDHCIAHGGGKRCGFPGGCTKAARGKSGLCIRHGGGKRCKMDNCTRSAEGEIGLCISHGGGRRCQFTGCTKGAQGSTIFCKAHGGGKRCIFAGCNKGAEGSTPLCKGHGGGKRCLFDGGGICSKSVHGGTNFCVAHGGGKRCAVRGCTKSARGRTDCCVKHGGGKRCRFEKCDKSAQGSTDFCKAHGGGKRCNWGGEGKCEKFARGKSGLCAAHMTAVHGQRETSKVGLIGPGLFHGLVPARSNFDNTCSSSGISVISDSFHTLEKPAKRHQLIPPQVLVPLSMKDLSFYTRPSDMDSEKRVENSDAGKSLEFGVPEGRVHGGGFMSFLGRDPMNAFHGS